VVKTLNAIESFKDGVMTAEDVMGVDGLEMLERLDRFRAEQAQGFRGTGTLSFAEKHNHHVFPQAFRQQFKEIVKGNFNINAFAVRMNEVFHLRKR
jgi:hypothetical protein